jgi:hypothetical protein
MWLYYTMEWFWAQGVVRCPGSVFVTQAGRTIYDLRGEEHEDVNHRGEPG